MVIYKPKVCTKCGYNHNLPTGLVCWDCGAML